MPNHTPHRTDEVVSCDKEFLFLCVCVKDDAGNDLCNKITVGVLKNNKKRENTILLLSSLPSVTSHSHLFAYTFMNAWV